MCVINVYGPTSIRQQQYPEETDNFYDALRTTLRQYTKSNYIVIMAGDFNAKLGLKREGEKFLGTYGKGTRNASGEKLAEFLIDQNMYATNTTFCKAMRYRTTWRAIIQDKQINNQIDYIFINRNIIDTHQHFLINSQSHDVMKFNSDHKMVISTFNLSAIYTLKRTILRQEDTNT